MTLTRLFLLAVLVAALGGVLHAKRGDSGRGYYPSGIRRWQGEGKPGKERGEWSWWYGDGRLREQGEFREFHRVGLWTQWYVNGQIANRGERVWVEEQNASPRHGPWVAWHPSGEKMWEGTFDRGARVGEWSFWKLRDGAAVLDEAKTGRYEAGERVE